MAKEALFDIAAFSDVGTERGHNEDACGTFAASSGAVVVVVADGVSSCEAGEEASRRAVEVTLSAFEEQGEGVALGKRLVQSVQQANIAIYDRALIVPELRGMTTTLTAVALDRGELVAAHVGDSRLYLVHNGRATQLTKDHTVTAERVRLGLLSEKRARHHPDRSTLTRSLGRELVVAVDRIATRVAQGDALIVCSDGLYNVLGAEEMVAELAEHDAVGAARALVEAANARGTHDNVTAAVVRVVGAVPAPPPRMGVLDRLRGFFERGARRGQLR